MTWQFYFCCYLEPEFKNMKIPKKEEFSHHAHHKCATQYNYKPASVASAVAAGNLVWEQLP